MTAGLVINKKGTGCKPVPFVLFKAFLRYSDMRFR
jgi:hypothetical protein